MNYDADRYGTTHREQMKTSMEHPAKAKRIAIPATKKVRRLFWHFVDDGYDASSFVVGWFIVAAAIGVVIAQIAMRYGWRP